MSNPERIWLQPDCCADPDTGRLWCQDPVWPDCGDCEQQGVEYIRADLVVHHVAGGINPTRVEAA